jgi:hypothetical protein
MMGRLDHDQGPLFYSFRLDEAVPDDHLVREIAGVLDLTWVHAELAPFYSKTGRPSIDPVLMIRMLIVGYVFAIRSERALCAWHLEPNENHGSDLPLVVQANRSVIRRPLKDSRGGHPALYGMQLHRSAALKRWSRNWSAATTGFASSPSTP